MKRSLPDDNIADFILYTTSDGDISIEVVLKDESVWLTQKSMAELFGVNVPAISKHLSNIFNSGELNKDSTVSILDTVQNEVNRKIS